MVHRYLDFVLVVLAGGQDVGRWETTHVPLAHEASNQSAGNPTQQTQTDMRLEHYAHREN
jgi:hypothetical protein